MGRVRGAIPAAPRARARMWSASLRLPLNPVLRYRLTVEVSRTSRGGTMTHQPPAQACGCCAPQPHGSSDPAVVRRQVSSAAARLGIADDGQRELLDLVEAGDCRAVRDHLAARVSARLGPAEQTVASLIGDAASTHR